MTKQKKKRTKVYSGKDAAAARPIVTRMSAVKRNKLQLWWSEKKQFARPVLIASGVGAIIIWLLSELIRLLFGGNA